MSTTIRPELSKKNKYWINRHRYYELKHFCLQYPIWTEALASLTALGAKSVEWEKVSTNEKKDPTERCAEARLYYLERIEMIEKAAKEADLGLWDYILKAVTEGLSYDHLLARYDIPCSKDMYYDRYRKFFWILNKLRE